MKLRKNLNFISSWENAPFDDTNKFPRAFLNWLKIDGENLLNDF